MNIARSFKINLATISLLIIFLICEYSIKSYCDISGNQKININNDEKIIIDSDYKLSEALEGIKIPGRIKQNIRLIDVEYYSFDKKLHRGQVLIHKDLADDIIKIFNRIKAEHFPVKQAVPIVKYNWSDEASMEANNTSAFNYRVVKGTRKLSAHALGRAIDINPKLNPQIKRGKKIPTGANYDPGKPGTITGHLFLVLEFKKKGWKWGGSWRSTKDYQHFEKR